MPPRKSPRNQPQTPVIPPVTANTGNTSSEIPIPPFQMDPAQLQTKMAHGIATALATYEATRNELASGNSGVGGLAQPIRSLVTSFRPSTYDSAKRLAYQLTKELIEGGSMTPQVVQSKGEKRKSRGRFRDNSKQQRTQSGPVAVYAATAVTPNQPKPYAGTAPRCEKCNLHHYKECRLCKHCGMNGHTIDYCRKLKVNCFECNLPGHFKKDCPRLTGQGGRGRAFVINAGEARQDPDVGTGTFLANTI